MTARLAPLLTGTAAGSLGPADLVEVGVSVVAVDVVELALGPGLAAVDAAGGLRAFTGWDGDFVAVGRWGVVASPGSGWRARALPVAVRESEGALTLRSSIDGSQVDLSLGGLAAWATAQGTTLGAGLEPGREIWADAAAPPPPGAVLVTALAQDEAHAGRSRSAGAWVALQDVSSERLAEGCACRSCRLATRGYVEHLWTQREITAEHLLCWHNLQQLRNEVES